ncbi:MAG: superoxide dismutase family protein [Gammaproteobacteria bacterium]|nr:superoxide dismutase family protein [Gammaproteobacteria bacterium]
MASNRSRKPDVTRLRALCALCLLVGVAAPVLAHEDGEIPNDVTAVAAIMSCDDYTRIGTAHLRERASDELVKIVDISMRVRRLTPGKHAVHIHETAACMPCSAAQGHFDPGPHGNTNPDANHPFHAGELVNIPIGENGRGALFTLTTRVSLSDGPLSLMDEDGSAFIIHLDPDTYCPEGEQAGCAGGGRAACGVIVRDE